MRRRSVLEFDVLLALVSIVLVTIGVMFIYSSGVTSSGDVVGREYIRQILWAISGVAILGLLTVMDYRRLLALGPPIYLALVGVLIVTLLFGQVVNGARSWIGVAGLGGQPSEFMKIGLILVLAWLYARKPDGARGMRTFATGGVLTLIPVALVLAQPDLGTAMVYLPIYLIVSFVAGASVAVVGFLVSVVLLGSVFTIIPVAVQYLDSGASFMSRVLSSPAGVRYALLGLGSVAAVAIVGRLVTRRALFGVIGYASSVLGLSVGVSVAARRVLQTYQLQRLIAFVDPYADPRGFGWNIIQSITAVGSGGPFGKGFLRGTHSHYQYLPQQSTDFIFSILAEEWGFVGSLVLFTLYGSVMIRALLISMNARDSFAAYLAAGVFGMFAFHFTINVGMAMGLMPITGIPLLFVSYGGSALWTAMTGVGLLLSIFQHRYLY